MREFDDAFSTPQS